MKCKRKDCPLNYPGGECGCSETPRVSTSTLNDLLYRFARHVLNVNSLHATAWGRQGLDLLSELQKIDPEKFKIDVQDKAAPSTI